MIVRYEIPIGWIRYDPFAVINELTEAKAAVMSLASIPYRRSWAQSLQDLALKREVAGTSRIEGAEFTEPELNVAFQDAPPRKHSLALSARRALLRSPTDGSRSCIRTSLSTRS